MSARLATEEPAGDKKETARKRITGVSGIVGVAQSAPRDPGAGRPGGTFEDEEADEVDVWRDAPREPLTRDEARALLARSRAVSPWFVLVVQAAVGGGVALLVALVSGHAEYGWSALYGAAVVVLPGALMARGMTSRLTSLTPALSAVSVLAWELVKISVSLAMLVLAGRLVQHLSWPAMLAAMVLCLQVYWVALRWRGR